MIWIILCLAELIVIIVLFVWGKRQLLLKKLFKTLFVTLNVWMMGITHELSICDYLNRNNYRRIAIYGVGEIGERLEEYLRNNGFDVMFAIDDKKKLVNSRMPVIRPDQLGCMDKPDLVIVTAEIKKRKINENLLRYDVDSISLKKLACNTVYGEYSREGE